MKLILTITILFFLLHEKEIWIQFIGEKSSLLTWHVTKYMNKAEKSELFDFDLNSKINKNKSLASYFRNFALRLMTHRECGALEAADTLLGIFLCGTDRNTIIKWLDVNSIRHRKLKEIVKKLKLLMVNL